MGLQIFTAILSAITAIVVAYLGYRASVDKRKNEVREKESRLSMQMMDASIQLSIVSANALTGGKNNGNVERAKKAAEEAQAAYKSFLQEVTSHEVSK